MEKLAISLCLLSISAVAGDFDGLWDATILSDGVKVPFRLQISDKVCFFEDQQPICSTSLQIQNGKLTAHWDFLHRDVSLSSTKNGLTGEFLNLRTKGVNAIEATRHVPPPASAAKSAKFDGEWEVSGPDTPEYRALPAMYKATWQLLLKQSGADLKGTILRVDGDDGTLTGRIDGTHFVISHFSGDRPELLEGTLLPDGTLDLKEGKVKLIGLRPAMARARHLPQPLNPDTFAKAKTTAPFQFKFPDLTGHVYTADDFAGKPVILSIMGSWCPNCRDEAPFLGELYQRYHASGLQVVGLAFEYSEDPEYVQLRAYIRKFGIQYPVLVAGEPLTMKTTFPQLDNVQAFPTAIYIGKDGRVRRVHTGFPGVGSGAEQARVKAEIRKLVEGMMGEPGLAR